MRALLWMVASAVVLAAGLGARPAAAQLPLGCTRYSYEDVYEATRRCDAEAADNQRRAEENWRRIQEGQRRLEDVRRRPNLPAAQNRLLGRWQVPTRPKPATKPTDLFTGLLAADQILKGGFCTVVLGDGAQLEFSEGRWASTDSYGRDDLGPVTYKSVGPNVVGVLPAQGLQIMVFAFDGPDRIRLVEDTEACTLTRISASSSASVAGPRPTTVPPPAASGGAPGRQQALNAPTPSSYQSDGRPPPEICRRAFLDELGRARATEVREVVRQRFRDSQAGVTPGTQNLRLMARASPCDDPRVGGVIYDFDAAGVLRQVINVWQRPQASFAETAALMARFATAPPRVTPGARAEGVTSLYRYVVEDQPARQVVTVTYTPLAP